MSEQITPINSNNEYLSRISELIDLYLNDENTKNEQKIDFQFISIMILYYIAKEEQIVDSIHSSGEIKGFDSSSCKIPKETIKKLADIIKRMNLRVVMPDGKEYTFDKLSDYIANSGKTVTVNSMQNKIKEKDIETLKKVVWVIHKIRDSFAHIQTIKFQDSISAENQPSDSEDILYNSLGMKINNRIPYDNSFFLCEISHIDLLKLVNILNEIVYENIDIVQAKEILETSFFEINDLFKKIIDEYDRYFESDIIQKNNILPYYENEKKEIPPVKNNNNESEMNKYTGIETNAINRKKYKIELVDSAISTTIEDIVSGKNANSDIKHTQHEITDKYQDTNKALVHAITTKNHETIWTSNLFMQEISKKLSIGQKNMLLVSFFNTFFSIYDEDIKSCNNMLNILSTIKIVESTSFTLLDQELNQKLSILDDYKNIDKLREEYKKLKDENDALEEEKKELIAKKKNLTTKEEKAEIGKKIGSINENQKIITIKLKNSNLKERIEIIDRMSEEEKYLRIQEISSSILTRIRNSLMHYNWTINKKTNTITFIDKTKKIDQNGNYVYDIKFKCSINIEKLYEILKELIRNKNMVSEEDKTIEEAIDIILFNLKKINYNSSQEQLNSMLEEYGNKNENQIQNKKLV